MQQERVTIEDTICRVYAFYCEIPALPILSNSQTRIAILLALLYLKEKAGQNLNVDFTT